LSTVATPFWPIPSWPVDHLAVTRESDTLVVVETGADIGGRYVTRQRFKYENLLDRGIVRKFVGYSGGFVKNPVIAQQVIAVEFVPFRGAYKDKEAKLDRGRGRSVLIKLISHGAWSRGTCKGRCCARCVAAAELDSANPPKGNGSGIGSIAAF